ncbi:HupE/UreJ family protein [Hyphomicrobium sp.]|uniref:HupE/UreJ family protein n=1 Tax=Hyphomicrobium sp. TaxID=82 RepID=UPI000FBAF1B3|nr:HupE/UreJ family protein [Hyphomicrobium sp.]RUP10892.1 MAG: HupE/UreJ family protein [Hyphomicrobium sp.]
MKVLRAQHVLKAFAAGSILTLAATAPASAHVGLGAVHTFSQGFLHPMSGIDHIIAMVAVGFFAINIGGSARWLVPTAFVVAMMFGGLLGYYGWPLPMVEQGIGLSVVAMSAAIAVGIRPPTVLAMAAVGLFAVFHGHAHGNEGAGLGFAFLPYAAGFVAATVLLHVSGMVSSLCIDQLKPSAALTFKRVSGVIGSLVGLSLLLGAMG